MFVREALFFSTLTSVFIRIAGVPMHAIPIEVSSYLLCTTRIQFARFCFVLILFKCTVRFIWNHSYNGQEWFIFNCCPRNILKTISINVIYWINMNSSIKILHLSVSRRRWRVIFSNYQFFLKKVHFWSVKSRKHLHCFTLSDQPTKVILELVATHLFSFEHS